MEIHPLVKLKAELRIICKLPNKFNKLISVWCNPFHFDKIINVFSILKNIGSKKHEFRQAGTGVPASRNRSSSEIAGISPYDRKSVNYSPVHLSTTFYRCC